jgi:hypothetical protein
MKLIRLIMICIYSFSCISFLLMLAFDNILFDYFAYFSLLISSVLMLIWQVKMKNHS